MSMHVWFEGKSCVACYMDLVAIYGLANDMLEEVGWCVEVYDLLVGVSMLCSMLVVSSSRCISVSLMSVYCVVSYVVSCALQFLRSNECSSVSRYSMFGCYPEGRWSL